MYRNHVHPTETICWRRYPCHQAMYTSGAGDFKPGNIYVQPGGGYRYFSISGIEIYSTYQYLFRYQSIDTSIDTKYRYLRYLTPLFQISQSERSSWLVCPLGWGFNTGSGSVANPNFKKPELGILCEPELFHELSFFEVSNKYFFIQSFSDERVIAGCISKRKKMKKVFFSYIKLKYSGFQFKAAL